MKVSTKRKHEKYPFLLEYKHIYSGQNEDEWDEKHIITEVDEFTDVSPTGVKTSKEKRLIIGTTKYVNEDEFAEIYASEIATLYGLSKTARNVFMYLFREMDSENKSFFNWKKIYKNYGTPYKGITELIENMIIAPTLIQNVYWISPAMASRNKRFTRYTEYIVTDETFYDSLSEEEQRAFIAEAQKEYDEELPFLEKELENLEREMKTLLGRELRYE